MVAQLQKSSLGKSSENRPLEVHIFSPNSILPPISDNSIGFDFPFPVILFLGGVHGDEIEGVWLMRTLVERWKLEFPSSQVGAIVWPEVNPDGIAKNQRWNGHSIDLNRNLPSKDWTAEIKNPKYPPGKYPGSEPENQALVALITQLQPLAILSAHSFHQYQININGPSREWGERLAPLCNYPITEDIGYPTPGCLGTYAGKELGIPTITLEIQRGLKQEQVLNLLLPLIEETLSYWSQRVKK